MNFFNRSLHAPEVCLRSEGYYTTAIRTAVTLYVQGLHKTVEQTQHITMTPQLIVTAARTTLRTLPWISFSFFENLLEINRAKQYHLITFCWGLTARLVSGRHGSRKTCRPHFLPMKKEPILGSFNLTIQLFVYSILKIST